MPKLAQYKECTGCMACVDSCSHNALQATLNEEGHIVPLIDESKCVNGIHVNALYSTNPESLNSNLVNCVKGSVL